MSLKEFMKKSGIDKTEDDSEFIENEYELVHSYFDDNGFTDEDLKEFYARGFDDDTLNCWKEQ